MVGDALVELTDGEGADVELLRRAAGGDGAAVRRLLDDAGPVVYGFVYARVGGNQSAAEDLTQEAIVEACRSAHTFRGDASLTTWMCAIARRRVARFFERERREEVARAGLALVTNDDDAGDDTDELADRDELIHALGRLPALHRQVLVLKYLDGLAVAEIADQLGRGRVQVQSLLQRARTGLRRAMHEEQNEEDDP